MLQWNDSWLQYILYLKVNASLGHLEALLRAERARNTSGFHQGSFKIFTLQRDVMRIIITQLSSLFRRSGETKVTSILELYLGPVNEDIGDLRLTQFRLKSCRNCSMHSPLALVSWLYQKIKWALVSMQITMEVSAFQSMPESSSTIEFG